jgi:hypothetical protein
MIYQIVVDCIENCGAVRTIPGLGSRADIAIKRSKIGQLDDAVQTVFS